MKQLLFSLMFLLATISSASAEIYQQGVVCVIYERTGETAVKDTDLNRNDVPDAIEDIATQLNAARELFHDVCGFPDPLGSERYANAKYIEIDIDLRSRMGHNGLAYSGKRKSQIDPNAQALHVRIASSVDPHKNPTAEHEYFHLIQYGATYFRNGWYLEGMARWSQDAVQAIKQYPSSKKLAQTLDSPNSTAAIFKAKYNAANLLWYPLAVDGKDKIKIPSALIAKYKYVDGAPVFEDDVFYGPNVMKRVLLALKSKESEAAEAFGGQKQWRKDGVRSAKNDVFILECVRAVRNERR